MASHLALVASSLAVMAQSFYESCVSVDAPQQSLLHLLDPWGTIRLGVVRFQVAAKLAAAAALSHYFAERLGWMDLLVREPRNKRISIAS